MNKNSVLLVWTVGAVALGPSNAWAVDAIQAVSAGMGNTVRANPSDTGSVYAAPGMVWLGERFDVGAGLGLGSDGTRVAQVSAYDGQTSNIGLGVHWSTTHLESIPSIEELPGWRRKGETFNNTVESSVLSATIGGGGVHHLFGVGLGVRYYQRTSSLHGADSSFNIAPSVAGVLGEQWTLSLTVENPLPLEYADAPFGIGTGTRWQPSDRFAVAIDTLTDLGSAQGEVRFTPMAGAEIRAHESVPMRIGWTQSGTTQQQWLTFGVGASNSAMGFDYAALLDVWSEGELMHSHRLALRISM